MTSQSLQQWALRELLVWGAAILCGYTTFSSFGPLYTGVKDAAVKAGYASLFDRGEGPISPHFETRVLAAGLPLRGTIPAKRNGQTAPHQVVLSANSYGHFHAEAEINGQTIEFMTDTGATYVALSYETAQKLGLAPQNLRFNGRSATANGVARVASMIIDAIKIGDITVKGVQAVIAEPGRMQQNLLGMSFIRQLSDFELNGSTLTMKE